MPARTLNDPIVEERLHAVLDICGVDPGIILRSLGRTGSIISGSVPLAVVKELGFVPNDVDLYVPESQEATMNSVVSEQLLFSRSRNVDVSYPEYLGIRKIQWFTRGAFKINLMIVVGENPLLAVGKFHSTIVMNIVTFNGLLVLFPDLTNRGLSLINTHFLMDVNHAERTMDCVERYRGRGILFETKLGNFSEFAEHRCGMDPNCPLTMRTLHDGHGQYYALRLHKDDQAIAGSAYDPYDGKHSMAWSIGGPTCRFGHAFHQSFVASLDIHPSEEQHRQQTDLSEVDRTYRSLSRH